MVISNLESHNKALQQEMDNVLSRHRHEEARRDENAQNYGDLAKQYSHLQQHHDNMYEEMKKELDSISHANTVLQGMAVMNVGNHQTIQERDEKIKLLQSTVFGFGDTHQRLTADLEVEKRRVENLEAANRRLAADLEAERRKDETIRTQSATIMAKTLKLIQVEEVHRRLQAALKEERRKNGTSKNETINNETTRNKTIKEEDDMAKDTDERINKKNATIRDKNSQINQLKDAKQKLEEALKAERRKNRHMGKMSAAGVAGAHTRATAAMKRQSENTRGPAHKKVKHVESTSEDAHHPHVVE
jgi:chromosome segregation ATPase